MVAKLNLNMFRRKGTTLLTEATKLPTIGAPNADTWLFTLQTQIFCLWSWHMDLAPFLGLLKTFSHISDNIWILLFLGLGKLREHTNSNIFPHRWQRSIFHPLPPSLFADPEQVPPPMHINDYQPRRKMPLNIFSRHLRVWPFYDPWKGPRVMAH